MEADDLLKNPMGGKVNITLPVDTSRQNNANEKLGSTNKHILVQPQLLENKTRQFYLTVSKYTITQTRQDRHILSMFSQIGIIKFKFKTYNSRSCK